ncbi:MAG: hypothetical protein IPI63_12365 [Methanothrix sp.]|jgi:hypothetical protein|uniref:hypothetical protein n=1 Tax=Methanothrix sp. TaxID=90426 RepID=UPI0025F20CB0|nr:hypothetical protein [Methanothrix sp.]MBK7387450.1 hypothetical protein [Methanothrix sp.]
MVFRRDDRGQVIVFARTVISLKDSEGSLMGAFLGIRHWGSGTGDQVLEIRYWRSGTGDQVLEIRY